MGRAACGAVMAALALGCGSAGARLAEVGRDLDPFSASDGWVVSSERVGPYVLARIEGDDSLALLTPPSPSCASVLAPEARVRYAKHGIFGRLVGSDGTTCDPVGTASLAVWRDRQPRAEGRAFPRATARYRTLHQGDGRVLLRGRFPLASRVGIPAGFDLVALVPDTPACAAALARGEASLEFRDAGPEPFRLVGAEGPCPVLGFAMPVDEAPPATGTEPP